MESLNHTQRINLGENSYDITFGCDLFSTIASELDSKNRHALITDSTVARLYARRLQSALRENNIDCQVIHFPAGEQSKTYEMCGKIFSALLEEKFDRDSMLIALGGGVVGDMTGWIAANYMRGIPFIQVPTTLLAQADSSVGGKTGVDFPQAKNSIGSFNQPRAVYIDIETLETLPYKEIASGLAETIKHGVIQDVKFFDYLENCTAAIEIKCKGNLLEVARQNCKIKGNVVEQDPNEKGLRRILNYGHTAGHAIEKLSNYTLPHGYCVSIGMMVAGRIATGLQTGFTQEDLTRQELLLEKVGLPIKIPSSMTDEDIIEVTTRDKKAKEGKARYCLPSRIGKMCSFNNQYATYVETRVVKDALTKTR